MHVLLPVLTIIAAAASTSARQDRLPLEIDVRGETGLREPVMLWYGIRSDSKAPRAKMLLVAVTCLVPALTLQVRPVGAVVGQRASLELDVPGTVTLREPVVMTLRLLNESDRPIRVNLGWDRVGVLLFEATGPSGRRQTGRPQLREGGSRSDHVDVAPHSQYSQRVVLDEWIEFDVVGAYVLLVRFSGSVDTDGSVQTDVRRDYVFSVVVLPRDPGRLEELCRSLESRLAQPQGLPDHRQAAQELAAVRDPVAIPYLERAAAREVSLPKIYETLAAIGTPEARQALERLSRHPTAWVAANAKAALGRIK